MTQIPCGIVILTRGATKVDILEELPEHKFD